MSQIGDELCDKKADKSKSPNRIPRSIEKKPLLSAFPSRKDQDRYRQVAPDEENSEAESSSQVIMWPSSSEAVKQPVPG